MRQRKTPDLHSEALIGNVCTDQEQRERLERYSQAKRHQQLVADYIQHDPTLSKEFNAISDCGQYLIFKHWITTGFRKLVNGFSCKKHLLCQCCSLRRDARYAWEYGLKIQKVLSENPHLIPVFITRTIKNRPDLLEGFLHLGKIHKGLMQRRRQSLSSGNTRGHSANSVMQYIAGSVGTYEFRRGKNSGMWHPHIHEIAFLDPTQDVHGKSVCMFTEKTEPGWKRDEQGEWQKCTRSIHVPVEFQKRLSQEYLEISGDSYIVDVRRIDCFDEVSGEFSQDLLMNSLCEVFKYALKFGELELSDQIHAYKVLKGHRLIFSYGCMRGVKVDDYLKDKNAEELEVGPYMYEMYTFINRDYQFSKFLDNNEYEEIVKDTGDLAQLKRRLEVDSDYEENHLFEKRMNDDIFEMRFQHIKRLKAQKRKEDEDKAIIAKFS